VRSLAVGLDDGRNRRALIGGFVQFRRVLLESPPLDIEHRAIAQHTKQVAGFHVFSLFDFDLGHLEQMLTGPVVRCFDRLGRRDRHLLKESPGVLDLVDLLLGDTVKNQRLPLRAKPGFGPLLLVLPFQQPLAGDGAAGSHFLEPGNFLFDHVKLLDGL